ncbi:N-6 DNA Methylase [Halomicrobium zhouii]|uniref:site-specific DNA-methyltransferase (adenine-specific) n=1 Tax=Halomicrobium zhouii TaxID=767519 RepID=A0A1I6M2M6_9EURY|nr:N-6 DNA methylase [Halomicrobium zhouii]SFS09888.1 N-6 DNA Methylase [Halomicrobium zhouii]
MSQLTLGPRPYDNSGLFNGDYLYTSVPEFDLWDCDDGAQEALDSISELYEDEGEFLDGYNEDELRGTWIDKILRILGYDFLNETSIPRGNGQVDYVLFNSESERRQSQRFNKSGDSNETFRHSLGFVEAKQWDEDFEREYVGRAYRNASSQVCHYLDRTPSNVRWGILTNGRKWRIYGNREYETQIYYEVDLVELIAKGDLEDFKYFYVFFGPHSLRGSIGDSFLDEVWTESENYSAQLGEDLQDNVFTALRLLGEGLVECNDLDIEPGDDEELAELKEQSLVYLYRLMFILYAEGKDLIRPEDPHARDEFEEHFSLEGRRKDIVEEAGVGGFFEDFSTRSRDYWDRLNRLFELIDKGDKELGIPAYNGGLFDAEEHQFLTENHVTDYYLAQVIYYLSTAINEDGELVYANYADLDTRHLGSVYEGLLEHQFKIAEEKMVAISEDGGQVWKTAAEIDDEEPVDTADENSLYVVNDEGERRSTGSYYTPDYIVTYIVENTLDPLIDDIRESLIEDGYEQGSHEYAGQFYARVLELNILDPAMGSGHFLTAVTSYLAEQVQETARDAELSSVLKEEVIRREIAKECIFGVDLNEMAVELAKLSMWLETLASDKPLTFLDHHFKQGNSLIGADLDEIDALPGHKSDEDEIEEEQSTLNLFQNTVQDTIKKYLKEYAEFEEIGDDTIDEIEKKKEKYEGLEHEEMRLRLEQLANVYTATHFDVEVPADAYDNLKKALSGEHETSWEEFTEKSWFKEAEAMAEKHDFLHWKLEFVEAFFNGSAKQSEKGFDAVVGNPPYFNLEIVDDEGVNETLKWNYDDLYAGKADILYFFVGLGINLIRDRGNLGYIVSRYFTEAHFAKDFRESVSDNADIHEIVDFGNNQVFPGVDTLTVVLELAKNRPVEDTTITYLLDELESDAQEIQQTMEKLTVGEETDMGGQYTIPESSFGSDRWGILSKTLLDIKDSIESNGTRLGEDYRTGQGMMTGLNEAFTVSDDEISTWGIEDEVLKPLVKNGDLRKYQYTSRGLQLLYLENKDISNYPNTKEYLSQYKPDLENRAKDNVEWYRFLNPINKELFESPDEKIICPFVATENRFIVDSDGLYNDGGDVEVIVPDINNLPDNRYLVCLLNSTLIEFYHLHHAKLKRDGFYEYFGNSLQDIPLCLEPADRDADVTVLPDSVIAGAEDDDVESVLSHVYDVMVEKHEKRKTLKEGLDPFKYLSRTASVNGLTDVLNEEMKYGSKVNDIVFDSRHDITDLELVEKSDSDDWVLRGQVKMREKVGEDYQWKRDDEDGNGIVRQWVKLYSFPGNLVDQNRMRKYQVVLENYDDFENKSPKNGFPGGRTRTVQEKLEKATLPVVDSVDMDPYFDLEDEIDELEADIMEIYRGVDQIVYDLYDMSDEEIDRVEDENGVGLELQ